MIRLACIRGRGGLALMLVGSAVLSTRVMWAQDTAPVTPVAAPETPSALARAALARTVTVQLTHISIAQALREVAQLGGIAIAFRQDALPAARRVMLSLDHVTVESALNSALQGTGATLTVSATGLVMVIVPTAGLVAALQQGTATLSGSIIDSGTGATIPQVTVHIDGTSLSVKSSADGLYKIPNIAAGEYRVTARRVGYLAKTRTITLADGDNKKLDFGLNPPATQLNEVVTTALGEQRRYEVGNVISTINVDSVAPNAPIMSVTDLLAARVPGLEVVQSNGLAGAGPDIRIRGQNSLLLQSDPIIIVDGIRVDNTPGNNNPIAVGASAPARINDLDLDDIESISVLKGPTATTEYGTDAANGVIVITTKRGHAGVPIWNASATEAAVIIPKTFQNYDWDWGHLDDGTGAPTWSVEQGGGVPCDFSPNSWDVAAGLCVIDSITAFNPFNHTATTEYGTGPSNTYNLSVGGGTEQMQYHLGGNVQNQEGLVHVPDVFRSEAAALGYSNSALSPNSQNQEQISANGTIRVNPQVQVAIQGAYMSTYAEMPRGGGFNTNIARGPAVDDSAFLFGYGVPGLGNEYLSPLVDLGQMISQGTEAWQGGGTIDWTPAPWLGAHLTTGIQHEAQTDEEQYLAQSRLVSSGFSDSTGGSLSLDQVRHDTYTIDFAASATAVVSRFLHLITTVGAQYVQTSAQGVTAGASDLPASAFSLNDAPSGDVNISQSAATLATEGVYAEEQLNVGDRCFMPLALRIDAGSAFGSAVGSQDYPKWGLSCLVLTGVTTLRLRGSYGAAGVQPPEGSAASEFAGTTGTFAGESPATIYQFISPGNPNLRPEDDQQWEGGADLNVWGNRLSVSVSAYDTYVHNALYNTSLGYLLNWNYTENIGDLRNIGEELEVTAVPLEGRMLTAAVTLSGSVNHNKLLRLAPTILSDEIGGGEWFVPGYPLYSYWGNSVQYNDLNKDGILESNSANGFPGLYSEVDEETNSNDDGHPSLYMGSSLPVTQMTMAPSVALFRRRLVQVNALFQYAGSYKVIDRDQTAFSDPAISTLGTPLWLQAYILVNGYNQNSGQYANSYLDGSYLSWNELSVALAFPAEWLHALRVRSAHVVLGVQNLALWTTYPFGDPRVSNGAAGSNAINNVATNTQTANNDIRFTSATVTPLPRSWLLRVNLGL